MNGPQVVVHAGPTELAQDTAGRLLMCLVDAQAARGWASIVLAGGRTATSVFAAVRDNPARDAVDWSRVDVWWGDERFLPAGDPERNETQARAQLLDALPLDPARVHAMPAADGADGDDPEAAAARYARALELAARPRDARLPRFDLLLLGVGEDGHVASVFPNHPAIDETRLVSAVRDSPKPPPVRLTLTLPALNSAAEVWLMATGPEKARAVGLALSGADPVPVPAAAVHGMEHTVWLLDRAAAADLSPGPR